MVEARQWLLENISFGPLASNRFLDADDALKFIEELYGAGAVTVMAVNLIDESPEGTYTDTLLIDLPKDQSKRQRLFEIANREARSEGLKLHTDKGQSQIELWWD